MNKEDNEETKEQNNPININKGETEDIEIEQNIEPSKQVQQLKELNIVDDEEEKKEGPSCKCNCILF